MATKRKNAEALAEEVEVEFKSVQVQPGRVRFTIELDRNECEPARAEEWFCATQLQVTFTIRPGSSSKETKGQELLMANVALKWIGIVESHGFRKIGPKNAGVYQVALLGIPPEEMEERGALTTIKARMGTMKFTVIGEARAAQCDEEAEEEHDA